MAMNSTRKRNVKALLSRREIEHLIAQGHQIVIVEGKAIKADSWLNFHPGGDKIILHMVGRDATDEVNAFHSTSARQRMDTYCIGRVEDRWVNFLPPVQGGHFRLLEKSTKGQCGSTSHLEEDLTKATTVEVVTALPILVMENDKDAMLQVDAISVSDDSNNSGEDEDITGTTEASMMKGWSEECIQIDSSKYPLLDTATQYDIVHKYRLLEQRVAAEGLYRCNLKSYAVEVSRYMTLLAFCLFFLHFGWYIVSAIFLGLFWHQLVFTAHDAGHLGITHDFTTDTVIGVLVADFLGGLSLGWWKRSHNIHHVVTNSAEHDPDVQLMPFFALSHRMFNSLYSTFYDKTLDYDAVSKIAVQYQKYLYYPILTFGRFNLYRLSWEHIIFGYGPRKGPAAWIRPLEVAGQLFFWTWFGYFLVYRSIPTFFSRVAFVLVSHMATMPLHVQITLSHYAMSTADVGTAESFPQKMLRTTMDVECPEWLDFVHGGLQFQAIHHLFPRMPRHNLRKARSLVQAFCEEVGIPYALHGFVDGNKQVIGRLGDVGRQAAILAKCQRAIAEQPGLGLDH